MSVIRDGDISDEKQFLHNNLRQELKPYLSRKVETDYGCKNYCEAHDREFLIIHEGIEHCSECAADGYESQLVTPGIDGTSSTNGKLDVNDRHEMNFMCDAHKAEKLKFIAECEDAFS